MSWQVHTELSIKARGKIETDEDDDASMYRTLFRKPAYLHAQTAL